MAEKLSVPDSERQLLEIVHLIKHSSVVDGYNIIIECTRASMRDQLEFDLDVIRGFRKQFPAMGDACDLILGTIIAENKVLEDERVGRDD